MEKDENLTKPGMREPQLVFDKHTPIPESASRIEDTPGSGPVFPDSSTNLLPLVEVGMADSDIESLEEMRRADEGRLTEHAKVAKLQLDIKRHNNLIRDVFAGKLIREVRIEEFDDGLNPNKDAHMLILVVRDGSAVESNGTRLTRWSLKHARCTIPGDWHEEIPSKVEEILQGLSVGEQGNPEVIHDIQERVLREERQRAAMSFEERLGALKRYNDALKTRYASKMLLSLKVENDGRSITLVDKFLDQTQKHTWKFDRNGRLF